ncbi:YaiO family outer membrane beta-barrel protein [Arvimicrobium flavum]|uniref:YaiO family outer membrane beta-barrel protein n=1 Tax=Arvimicrobium flavum TaxID=3393320 RepID=UPI00237AD437|nr:YaiO family outer membrane beta-barrel protein [Mesorhizobium shangrilense]
MRLQCLAAGLCMALAVDAHAQTVDELYSQGVKARQEQRFEDASTLLRRALSLQPANSDTLVQLGFAELGLGNLAAARTAFSNALAIAPDYADAKFGLAQVEFRSGNPAAARALVEPLVTQQPGNQEAAALLTTVRAALETERDAAAAATAAKPRRAEGQATTARSDAVAPLLDEARRLRTAGQFAQAESLYRRALSISPRNTDILVALGLVAGFQQRFDEADRFFSAALAIDPDQFDARLGKVRLAIWRGDVARARQMIDGVLADVPGNTEAMVVDARISMLERDYAGAEESFASAAAADPANAEALVGLGDVRRARGDEVSARQAYENALLLQPDSVEIAQRLAAAPPQKWRLDIGSELSELSAGLGNWTDSGIGLSYRATPDTVLGARMRVATRFGRTDAQIEGRIDHAFAPSFSAYGVIAGTPQADFLAKFSAGAGASWRAIESVGGIGPVFLNLDARYDLFDATENTTISPWVQAYFFDERLGLSARWVHSENDRGRVADGYVLRADLTVTDRLRLFGGYSDAPEISEATLIETRTAFGGVSFDISDDLTLLGSYANEQRPTFERNIFGLGLAVRF